MATLAPSEAKRKAMPRPIPVLPPVLHTMNQPRKSGCSKAGLHGGHFSRKASDHDFFLRDGRGVREGPVFWKGQYPVGWSLVTECGDEPQEMVGRPWRHCVGRPRRTRAGRPGS